MLLYDTFVRTTDNFPAPSQGVEEEMAFCREILEKSTTPFEKLNANFEQGQQTDQLSLAIYTDFWTKVASSQRNPEKLQKFFEYANIGLTELHQLLAPAKWVGGEDYPLWTAVLRDVLRCNNKAIISFDESYEQLPFEELFSPFIYAFRESVYRGLNKEERSLLTTKAQMDFEHLLLEKLSSLATITLFNEFQQYRNAVSSPEQDAKKAQSADPDRYYYHHFIRQHQDDQYRKLFANYPMLCRLLCQQVCLYEHSTIRLIKRLCKDQTAIAHHLNLSKEPGPIQSLVSGISDAHNGGEGVVILAFNDGLKLVYKPRDMEISKAYGNLCEWINQQLDIEVKVISTLCRKGYGWMEFVAYGPCQTPAEVKQYYQRAGVLLGITHVLGASDFHSENVIASGAHPVLIDHETILQPQVNHHSQQSDTPLTTKQKLSEHSVLRTHLLPMYTRSLGLESDVTSGFGSIQGHNHIVVRLRKIAHLNTDRMYAKEETSYEGRYENVPTLNGTPQMIHEYGEDLAAGFTAIYKLLQQHRADLVDTNGQLRFFSNIHLRFLFRATQVYTSVLENLLTPKYLKDANMYGLRLELLARAFLPSGDKPLYWPILAQERQEMLIRDVPCFSFYSDQDILEVNNGGQLSAYFKRSCTEAIKARLDILSSEDLDFQLRTIRESLAGRFNSFNWG